MIDDVAATAPGTNHRVAQASIAAAEEIQRLNIGYPGGDPIAHGSSDRPTAVLVVTHHDPLDEKVWVLPAEGRARKPVSPRPEQP